MRDGVQGCKGGGNTVANLGGICVRGRGVGEHPGRPKHRPVLVAAAAVLTVRVEAEAHPPAQPHQLHYQCAPLGCRQATDSSRAAATAGSPASFSAAAAQACLRSNSPAEFGRKRTKIQSKPCFDIVIWMQAMLFDTSEQSSRMRRLSFLNSAGLEGGELPLILSPNYPPPNLAQTHTKPHVEKIKSEFQSSNQELTTQRSGATDCLKFPLLSKAVNRVS